MNRPANTSGSTPVSVRTSGTVKNNASLQQRSSSVGHVAKTWPPETNLVISPKRKVKLTIQQPVIRVLLKDAIKSVRASLLFDNAFPNTDEALTVIQKSIFYAAERYCMNRARQSFLSDSSVTMSTYRKCVLWYVLYL